MRGTEAKRLRKLAREATEGKPERHMVATKSNPTTHFNHPESTRGVYRMLKKYRAVTTQKEKANG